MLLTGTCTVPVTYRSVTLSSDRRAVFYETRRCAAGRRRTDLGFGCGEGCDPPKKKAAEKVSDAARELFYKHGIRAVGVDEIVNQAGVTKPSLYRSYSSKDALIASC